MPTPAPVARVVAPPPRRQQRLELQRRAPSQPGGPLSLPRSRWRQQQVGRCRRRCACACRRAPGGRERGGRWAALRVRAEHRAGRRRPARTGWRDGREPTAAARVSGTHTHVPPPQASFLGVSGYFLIMVFQGVGFFGVEGSVVSSGSRVCRVFKDPEASSLPDLRPHTQVSVPILSQSPWCGGGARVGSPLHRPPLLPLRVQLACGSEGASLPCPGHPCVAGRAGWAASACAVRVLVKQGAGRATGATGEGRASSCRVEGSGSGMSVGAGAAPGPFVRRSVDGLRWSGLRGWDLGG